ncbi:hypothetical protein [Pseudomonas sp. H3_E03]
MRILKTLLLPLLLILSLIGVDRPKTWKPPSPPCGSELARDDDGTANTEAD